MFVEMQIFTFEYFICNIPISRLRGKNGSHSEENSKALKMGPIYRDQFVSLHYFSVQLSSTPEASEAGEARSSGGGGSLLPWRWTGANGHIIKSKLEMYKAFVMLILFLFLFFK